MPRQRSHITTRPELSFLNWQNPTATGITNYWSFSERQGDEIQDRVRNNNAITLNNGGAGATPSWVSGLDVPGAFFILFDGSNGGSNRAVTGVPNPSTPHSLAVWIDMVSSGALGTLVGYGNDSTNTGHNLVVSAGNTIIVRRVSTGATVVSFAYPAGRWRHIVYTYDGTNNVLYHNGTQFATTTTAPQGATVNAVTVGENVHTGFPERALNGTRLSSVCFYNRPLRAGEVFSLYDTQSKWGFVRPRKSGLPPGTDAVLSASNIAAFASRTIFIPGVN